jgi:small subunit ribosomal protein S5
VVVLSASRQSWLLEMKNGIVGYGLGKAKEVTEAIAKGIDDAKKNLVKVPLLNGTVPHEQIGKFSGGFCFD